MADKLSKLIERNKRSKDTQSFADRIQAVVELHMTEDNGVELAAVLLQTVGMLMTSPELMVLEAEEKVRFVLSNVEDGYNSTMRELAIRAGRLADLEPPKAH